MGNDTIYAIASGAGRAAIAVLRLSGPAVRTIVKSLAEQRLWGGADIGLSKVVRTARSNGAMTS